jgi:SAM-dependent methyltransferase
LVLIFVWRSCCSAPLNVAFEITDAEDDWTYNTEFDFIHLRAVLTCFRDPKEVFTNAYNALAPGGYIQLRDPLFPMMYLTPPPADCSLPRWNELILEAAERMGRPWTNAQHYRRWLEEIGFCEVVEIRERLPLSPWAKSRRLKYLSLWLQHNMLIGLEAMSMALFTRALGWEAERVREFLVGVTRDIQDTNIHAYTEGYVAIPIRFSKLR